MVREGQSIPHAVALISTATMLWVAFVIILQLGASTITALLLTFTLLFAVFGAIVLMRYIPQLPPIMGTISLGLALLCILLIIVLSTNVLQRLIPICGDGVCSAGECARECGDCTLAMCENGVCDLDKERCDTSNDCACPLNTVCVPARNGTSTQGCYPVICGDLYCDPALEGITSCCTDCGCQQGFGCENNICFFQPPSLTFTPHFLTRELSVTSIAANPMFTNASGGSRPLVGFALRNRISPAYNTTLTIELPLVERKIIPLGTVWTDTERVVLFYLDRHVDLIQYTQSQQVNLSVSISYLDAQEVAHTANWQYPFILNGRSTLDEYGHVVFYVTPQDVPLLANEAESIWNKLSGTIAVREHKGVQFPRETLARGEGSRADIAILLASLFERAGVRSSLVETKRGLVVRVRDEEEYIMLDPALLDGSFEEAIIAEPGYAVHEISQIRSFMNASLLSLGDNFIPGTHIRTEQNIEQSCVCDEGCPKVSATYTVWNDASLAAPLCGISTLVMGDQTVDVRERCFTISEGDSYSLVHGWRGYGPCREIKAHFVVRNETS